MPSFLAALTNLFSSSSEKLHPSLPAEQGIKHADSQHFSSALALVKKQPELFFDLAPIMQQQIEQALLYGQRSEIQDGNNTNTTTLKEIKRTAQKSCELLEINPNELLTQQTKNLITAIYDKIKDKAAVLFHKEAAIAKITNYLERDERTAVKINFFNKLRAQIRKEGLNLTILQNTLTQYKDRLTLLFKHWRGPLHSEAADCLNELYQLATLHNKPLSKLELENMTQHGEFPSPVGVDSAREQAVQDNIKMFLENPSRLPPTELTRLIARESHVIKTLQQQATSQSPIFIAEQKVRAEAIYQQKLVQKGLTLAQENCCFDTQGHVLVEIPTDDKLRSTFCNLDVKDTALEQAFLTWVNPAGDNTLRSALQKLMQSNERASIIPLQEEMSMHMRLLSRALGSLMNDVSKEQWEDIRNKADQKINDAVRTEFQAALLESYNTQDNKNDYQKLNQQLDEARARLAPQCKTALIQACRKVIGDDFSGKFNKISKQLNKKLFCQFTATDADYMRTDLGLGATRVTGTEETAHAKKQDKQAFRVLHRTNYDIQNNEITITPLSQTHAQARVPSIALQDNPKYADESLTHHEAVLDVANKLRQSYEQLQQQLGGYQGPMIYNLLTSPQTKLRDNTFDRKNQQRLSLSRICKGAHVFNKQQVGNGNIDALCYVQNISVNQFGNDLNYDASTDSTREATLFAEMALLSTFKQNSALLPPVLRDWIHYHHYHMHHLYVDFLTHHDQGNLYFCNSRQGKRLVGQFVALKQFVYDNQAALILSDKATLPELVTCALLKIMASNKHWDKQHGMLVQALSVFIEKCAQYGCKSANERFQGVAGRVGVLVAINEKRLAEQSLSMEEDNLVRALTNFVNDPKITTPHALQIALDKTYNNYNLYGAAAHVSHCDQGASSKLKPTSNHESYVVKERLNTNRGESGLLTKLKQNYCSNMQSHKGKHGKELCRIVSHMTASQKPVMPVAGATKRPSLLK